MCKCVIISEIIHTCRSPLETFEIQVKFPLILSRLRFVLAVSHSSHFFFTELHIYFFPRPKSPAHFTHFHFQHIPRLLSHSLSLSLALGSFFPDLVFLGSKILHSVVAVANMHHSIFVGSFSRASNYLLWLLSHKKPSECSVDESERVRQSNQRRRPFCFLRWKMLFGEHLFLAFDCCVFVFSPILSRPVRFILLFKITND